MARERGESFLSDRAFPALPFPGKYGVPFLASSSPLSFSPLRQRCISALRRRNSISVWSERGLCSRQDDWIFVQITRHVYAALKAFFRHGRSDALSRASPP